MQQLQLNGIAFQFALFSHFIAPLLPHSITLMVVPQVRNSVIKMVSRVPLHVLFILLFVPQIFGTVALVGYLSFKNGQKAVNNLAEQLLDKTSAQVKQHLVSYLEIPLLLAQSNAKNAQLNAINFERSRQLERYLWEQIKLYSSIDATYLGNREGQFTAVWREENGSYILKFLEESPERKFYTLNNQGERGKMYKQDRYDPRERPWYQNALKTRSANWSEIYHFSDGTLGMTASAPFYDVNQEFQGATGINVKLSSLNSFLKSLEISPHSQISILEPSGYLVATSTEAEVVLLHPEQKKEQQRAAMTSKHPLAKAIAKHISERYSGFSQFATGQKFDFFFNGERNYVQVMPYRNVGGLNWLIVVVVPENDFMGQINANKRLTIGLCLLALVGATGVGILTARWLIAPLARFVEATDLLANGELDKTVEEGYIREIKILARSFNRMICQLQAAFFKLEMANAELEERVEERTKDLEGEREKSERLLLNILPETIAQRLKHNQASIAEYFEDVTLLFADIVGFTPLSARLKPIELVSLLNEMFSVFDTLADYYGLEKIKTIGDAYMVAGGLPVPQAESAEAIAHMALDMLAAVHYFNLKRGENFQIRVGLNTGNVVAGVIGTKKFIYDVWGDAVNVASRMESSSHPSKIHVTAVVRERLKDRFIFEERGIIEIKGKGSMNTYWLRDRISPLSSTDSPLLKLGLNLESNSHSFSHPTESRIDSAISP